LRQFVADARKQCGASRGDVTRGARIISADTIEVESLRVASAVIDTAWTRAVRAGLLTLPAQVEREWIMMDGFTYVIELRYGNRYRAVEIEHVEKPEVVADAVVQEVHAALVGISEFAERPPP
jgi:hypothetical protein